jgi:hypothetical protein
MNGPTLEDIEGSFLDAPTMAILGDSISYKTSGGSFVAIRGYVDFGESARDLETGQIIAQEITVEVLRTDVPVRPNAQCRVTIGKLAGRIYKPVNIRNSEDGNHWLFEVDRVNA